MSPFRRSIPRIPDTVYVASVVTWKSTDAGKTWYGLRGAPGGDDYQNVFVNPNNTKIIALASDQGVIISQNGGETWTQWFNQATAQVYHVTADNAFPYRVCGGQQDSGSACVDSRSNDGRITFHDWHPVGIEEYGYAAPGSARSRHRLRRQGHALRSPHRPDSERRAKAAAQLSRSAHAAAAVLAGRSAQALLRHEHAVADGRRRQALEGGEP